MKQMWKYFRALAHIPRGSGEEVAVAEYLIEFAKDRNLEWIHEPCGNVIIKKAGTSGKEQAPPVILQCHMDMVCEKNENSNHNFSTDRIQLVVQGDWIRADGTTLGADNGIGVVMAMAILNKQNIAHPPLEVLFTVEEETGLVGARELNPKHFKGTRLINLDSEEEGVFYSGCAGGVRLYSEGSFSSEKPTDNLNFWELRVTGFTGGHSGIDINKGRGNPILIATEIINTLCKKIEGVQLAEIRGGGKDNAIPRECFITFALPTSTTESDIESATIAIQKELLEVHTETDPEATIQLCHGQRTATICSKEDTNNIVSTLKDTAHGVIAMSKEVEGVVETSTNLASILLTDGSYRIVSSQRSFIEKEREAITARIITHLKGIGATSVEHNPYPGWAPDSSSKLLATACELYQQTTGKEAQVTAIHAGLECGLLKAKLPHLDCISLGPDIEEVHTPQERASLSSGNRVAEFLMQLLEVL